MILVPFRYPRRRRGNLTGLRTFVRYIFHRDIKKVRKQAVHLPPTLGRALRRLEVGEFSPNSVKKRLD
ncbi:hypothetical protein EVJ33_04880 [Exiguobacterium sp. SL-10]|nr:hypothetical protein EVJ33_04880 [Exiguobacterium sp. SL-10]